MPAWLVLVAAGVALCCQQLRWLKLKQQLPQLYGYHSQQLPLHQQQGAQWAAQGADAQVNE